MLVYARSTDIFCIFLNIGLQQRYLRFFYESALSACGTVNNRLAKMRRLLITSGTDFSGFKHALLFSLTEEKESERESGIHPNSQEREKCILSAFTPAAALPLQEFL